MAGSIQGDINQALGTLGVLATLSPQLQEHAGNIAENRKLDKRQKVLDQQQEVFVQDLQKKFTPDTEGILPINKDNIQPPIKESLRQNQEQEDISRARYNLKPTLENYQKWQKDALYNQELKDDFANIAKQKKAMDKVGRLQEAKQTQKRNFMAYLAQQPTSLGGTVGDLSPDLQKKIASQYSKSQRKALMDRMDKEAENGKQQ